MSVLLLDRDEIGTRYCSRFWTIFSCRNGIYSPLERAKASGQDIYYAHPNNDYEQLASALLEVLPASSKGSNLSLDQFGTVVDSSELMPGKTLKELSSGIETDLPTLLASGVFATLQPSEGVYVIGDPSLVYCHKDATVYPGTIINTEGGPVIIDAGTKAGQFSYIAGPVYIGKNCQIDNCRVLGPSVIGHNCRVGGEIEETIFGDYSNKHHEGFLGHSFVGRWVNIGALATTSDLKNNYGTVNLEAPEAFLNSQSNLHKVSTDTNKFGSIISDCVKVAIGTMLNTGTILDAGSNIFEKPVPKYVPPFSWGPSDTRYQLDRFLKDCDTIFARRQEAPSDEFKAIAGYLWAQAK